MRIQPKKLAQLFQCVAVLVFACFFGAQPTLANTTNLPMQNPKIPVIIDTDMGIDDWFALLYLFNRTDVDILAITLPITAQSHCTPGMNNVNKLIDLSGKMANKIIPVACGQSYYTKKHVVSFPEKWRREADSLAGIPLPLSSRRPLTISAEQLIEEVVDKQAKLGVKPIIIALGPLTNIANILEKNPDFKNKIDHVISMGGAVSVKGNVEYGGPLYPNKMAEWNYYADPLAAEKVIESGIAFKMVPLDATDMVPLNQEFLNNFKQMKKTRIAEFIYSALRKRHQIKAFTGYCFWDCLTVSLVFDESLGSFKNLPIKINYDNPHVSGQTVVDHQNGQYIQVALGANPKRFHQDFLEVVNR